MDENWPWLLFELLGQWKWWKELEKIGISFHQLVNKIYMCCFAEKIYQLTMQLFNILRPRQFGRHFPDIFQRIFVNENIRILIWISLTFVPRVPIDNKPALVQDVAWCRPGDKPLSEPMMLRLPTHICVTWPQWVKVISGTVFAIYMFLCVCVLKIIMIKIGVVLFTRKISFETLSLLLAICKWNHPRVTHRGEVIWSFDIFLVVNLNKLLNKQSK